MINEKYQSKYFLVFLFPIWQKMFYFCLTVGENFWKIFIKVTETEEIFQGCLTFWRSFQFWKKKKDAKSR